MLLQTKHLELIKAENRTLEQDLAKSEESCRDLQQQIHDQYVMFFVLRFTS